MAERARSAREELIGIQRSLVRRIRGEIFASLEPPGSELEAYQREYDRSCRAGYRRILPRRTFIARLERAGIVFQGDFHTLLESQATTLRFVSELSRRRPVVLALEMVPLDGQAALDAFLADELDEVGFLEAIDYESVWGFCWAHYRPILEYARTMELPVYGINATATVGESSLSLRDRLAAEAVCRAAVSHPDAIVYVVAGDFHVCRKHLPAATREVLVRDGVRRRAVIVHQNIDSLYWELARHELEHAARYLELGPDELCVMNSTPLVKYQSYLHWQYGQDELLGDHSDPTERHSSTVASDEVHRLVRVIARVLGIRRKDLDDFVVYTTDDLDFLATLEERGDFSAAEIREIKRQILNDESYFISRGNIIYLSRLSLDHAAEEAAHYINAKLSGHIPRPRPARTDFYDRVLREALGFLGSRIINPLRHHHGEDDFRELLARAGRKRLPPEEATVATLSRFVLQHLDAERRLASGGRWPRFRNLYRQPLDLHLGITHSLGYILGDKLYRCLLTGALKRSEVRRLFSLPLTRELEAEGTYFDLVRRL